MYDFDFTEVTCDCYACGLLNDEYSFSEPPYSLLRSALTFIESEDSYESWLWIGAVIHRETGGCEDGFSLFNAWSKKHNDYRGPELTYRIWLSFSHGRPWSADLFALRDDLETLGVDWQEVISQAEDSFFWMEVAVEDYV
jgi:hypothetical protein